MSKRRFIYLIFVVMFGLCAVRWKAQGDVPNIPEIHNIRGASFDLTVSDTGGALELIIKPATSGDYAYSFSLVSGDSEITAASAAGYCSYKTGEEIKASFDCALPDLGETIRYSVKANFIPNNTSPTISGDKTGSGDVKINEVETESKDIVGTNHSSSNNGGSCGLYVVPAAADVVFPPEPERVERYVSRDFSAKAEVTNMNGTAYVDITEIYNPPFEEYSYY